MEALATSSIHFHSFLPSSSSSSSLPLPFKLPISLKPSFSSPLNLSISISTPLLSLKSPLFLLQCSTLEGAVLETTDETQDLNQKRKLYVVNLPWTFSVEDLKKVFSECGTVRDVELIKNQDGRNRGYAFVTMASGDEAQAVIDKFNSTELSGRTIGVEYARKLKKPRPQAPAFLEKETRHKLYVSNLQWKVRSSQLREFFSADFNPVSVRVVFESNSGRSAGYGFVSFATKEEAEAALSALNEKELMGRALRLKFSDKNTDEEGEAVEKTEQGEAVAETDNLDEPVTELGEDKISSE